VRWSAMARTALVGDHATDAPEVSTPGRIVLKDLHSRPVAASHNRTVSSADPVASTLPSDDHVIVRIGPRCPTQRLNGMSKCCLLAVRSLFAAVADLLPLVAALRVVGAGPRRLAGFVARDRGVEDLAAMRTAGSWQGQDLVYSLARAIVRAARRASTRGSSDREPHAGRRTHHLAAERYKLIGGERRDDEHSRGAGRSGR
jgi:hypothetical protein